MTGGPAARRHVHAGSSKSLEMPGQGADEAAAKLRAGSDSEVHPTATVPAPTASPPPSAGRGGSSSVGRDSGSPAAAAQWEWDGEEVEGGDGEVQSSYKGEPFDTMDALQEALPFR